MSTSKTTYELTREVTVEYEFHRASLGRRGSFGVPEEPDEDEEVVIVSVKSETGQELELTDDEVEDMARTILDEVKYSRLCGDDE